MSALTSKSDTTYLESLAWSRTAEKNTAGDGGVKYALRDGTTKGASDLSRDDLRYLLESAQYGVLTDSSYIPLRRNTPEFFIRVVEAHSKGTVVVKNCPMAATVEHLKIGRAHV